MRHSYITISFCTQPVFHQSVLQCLGDVVGVEPSEIDLANFSVTSGASAVRGLASDLDKEADELIGNDDRVAGDTLKAMARDLSALLITQFASIERFHHGIAEDGDLGSDTLIFTNKDGSIVVFSYTDFPF